MHYTVYAKLVFVKGPADVSGTGMSRYLCTCASKLQRLSQLYVLCMLLMMGVVMIMVKLLKLSGTTRLRFKMREGIFMCPDPFYSILAFLHAASLSCVYFY